MFTYSKKLEETIKFLDYFNFTRALEWCRAYNIRDLTDIKESLQKWYCEDVKEALNNLNTDEFEEYFRMRYNIRWYEYTQIYTSFDTDIKRIEDG